MPITTLNKYITELKDTYPPLREARYEPCCDFARRLLALGGVPWTVVEQALDEAHLRSAAGSLPSRQELQRYRVDHSCEVRTRCQFCRNYWALEYVKSLDYQFIIGPGRPAIFREGGDDAEYFLVCDEPRKKLDPETGEACGLELCYAKHSNSLIRLYGTTPCTCHVYRKSEVTSDSLLERTGQIFYAYF